MPERDPHPRLLIYTVSAMLVLAAMASLVVNQANRSRARLPVYNTLSDFQFVSAGNEQPFGLEQMKGKLNVVYFGFTNCKSVCPIMVENMFDLYDYYAEFPQVQFITISVDPDRDSFETLREYAREHRIVDDRWVFLKAPIEDVIELCEKQFMLPAESLPMGHTTKFILVDHLGQIRSYHEGLDSEAMIPLKDNIRQLAKELP